MNRGPFLLSNRGGGGHPTASLIYPTACSCLKPSCLCQHTHTQMFSHECHSLIFCQLLLLSVYRCWVWPDARVATRACVGVCLRGQGDESGPYLLLISAGHHLYLKLTPFIVVTQTQKGSIDPTTLWWWLQSKVSSAGILPLISFRFLFSVGWNPFFPSFICNLGFVRRDVYWDLSSCRTPCLYPPQGNKQSTNIMKYYHVKYGGLWQQLPTGTYSSSIFRCQVIVLIVLWEWEIARVAQLYILPCLSFVLPPLFLFLHLHPVTQIMLFSSILSGDAGFTC